jgi:hypothetical protein
VIDGVIGPQRLAVEAVSGLGSPQHLESPQAAGSQNLEVASTSLDRPAAAQAADFARAAAVTPHGAPAHDVSTHDVSSVREVQAAPPPAEGRWTDWIARQMKDLEPSLKLPNAAAGHANGAAPAGASHGLGSGTDAAKGDTIKNDAFNRKSFVEEGIAQMDQAYAFAIKATLASHGSSEATKIFNTLLKGG